MCLINCFVCVSFRHDERRGPPPSRARLQDASPPGMLPAALRNHARMLAQGSGQEADLWDPPVEAGGLLLDPRLWVQRCKYVLTSVATRLAKLEKWLKEKRMFLTQNYHSRSFYEACEERKSTCNHIGDRKKKCINWWKNWNACVWEREISSRTRCYRNKQLRTC